MKLKKWLQEHFSRWAKSQHLEDPAGRRKPGSWRQYSLARVTELHARLESIKVARRGDEQAEKKMAGVEKNLDAAREAAARMFANFSGAAAERTWNNIHAAEEVLLEIANEECLEAWGIDVLAVARRHLRGEDPRLIALEDLLYEERLPPPPRRPLLNKDRWIAVWALRAANSASSTERMQARSFRNVLYGSTVILALLAAGIVVFGLFKHEVLNLCFPASSPTICPAGGKGTPGGYDILIVEVVGMAAAGLTAALSLRDLNGTSTPYSIPTALTFLKLPAGALAAVIGMVLINAGIIPGLDRLNTQGQILAWAALFGAGQLALTRFIDEKGQQVLNNVREPGKKSDESSDSS